MKKYSKILFSFLALFIFTNNVYATTIKETTVTNDNYDTIERNTTIIGATKFTANEVITASKATTAGANDATLYMKKNGTIEGYIAPTIYIYYGPVGGWYSLDENNKATYIEDKDLISKLSNLDIYYVNNKEKVIGVEYTGDAIDATKLPKGVSYNDNKLLANSTLSNFEITTKKGKRISYSLNSTTSTYEIDTLSCYDVLNGYITYYSEDESCPKDVIIPSKINNETIIGISEGAFAGHEINSVIIPETIVDIQHAAFAYNDLTKVIIKGKYDLEPTSGYCAECFKNVGEEAFGDFTDFTFENKLTRALDLISNPYEINVAKEFKCKNFNESFNSCEYIIDSYLRISIEELLTTNGYNLDEMSVDISVSEDETKYEVEFTTRDAYYHNVSKPLNIEIKEFEATASEQTEINNILKDIEEANDPYFEGYLNNQLFENIQKKYDFNITQHTYIPNGYGGGEVTLQSKIDPSINTSGENYEDGLYGETIIITKNNKLYGATTYKETIYAYYVDNNYSMGSYSTPQEYVEKYLLKEITDKYKIKNYEIEIMDEEEAEYYEFYYYNDTENIKNYYMYLLDKDTNLLWIVQFYKTNDKICTKEVPIKVIPTGDLPSGKAISSITPSALKVTIYGTEEAIQDIDYLPVELYVGEMESNEIFNEWLTTPETVEKLSLNHITVNITLGEEVTKEIKDVLIEVMNLDSEYKAAAIGESSVKTNVIVKGTQEVLDTIDESRVKVIIDLEGYTEGDYQVNLIAKGDDVRAKYISSTEYINVRITKK